MFYNTILLEQAVSGQVQSRNFVKVWVAEFTNMYLTVTSFGIWILERELYSHRSKQTTMICVKARVLKILSALFLGSVSQRQVLQKITNSTLLKIKTENLDQNFKLIVNKNFTETKF